MLCIAAMMIALLLCSISIWHRSVSKSKVFEGTSIVVPLIILKLPRSGSSWVTEELNEIPTVFISKEIVQRGDRNEFTTEAIEEHFVKALRNPTGKLSSIKDYLPTGRFFEDYLLHKSLKVLKDMRVVGFTVNPEHCKDVKWQRVQESVPNMNIVALIRSNVIKSALSGYRGKQTMVLCGSSNLRFSPLSNCSLPKSVDWSVDDFFREVSEWQDRYEEFEKVTSRISNLNHIPVQIIYYEDMQINIDNTFTYLFKIIGLPESEAIALTKTKIVSNPQTGWQKRSSEDLQSLLTKYGEIESTLVNGRCSCLLKQLRAKNAQLFPPCKERFDAVLQSCKISA